MAGRHSKEDITANFPEYYKPLSRRLYKVLEDIGAATEMRDLYGKLMTNQEIRLTVFDNFLAEPDNIGTGRPTENSRSSSYICGSSFEGTTTMGLEADVDMLLVIEYQPVVTDISDAKLHDKCFLMIQTTPPGYVKLQWVEHGVPQFLSSAYSPSVMTGYDKEYRAVLINNADIDDDESVNGPARSTAETLTTPARDFVLAVRCRKIPDCASEWFIRQRHYNWPAAEWIDMCKTLGCFFVYVGHPDSDEKHLQWRMSFSLQERFLVTQFNSVQLKCYILMKIIKKDIIHKDMGEKFLTSYHCKTCMLYVIENTPAKFWGEDNLLVCLHACLSQILRCVETVECPNYFIPNENMFDGRLHGETLIKLQMVLRNILSADFSFLLHLKTDDLGKRFQDAVVAEVQESRFTSGVDYMKKSLADKHVSNLMCHRIEILQKCLNSQSDKVLTAKRLMRLQLILQNTERVTEHTQEQTKHALSPLFQYIEISLMSVTTVLAKTLHKSSAFIFQILTSEKWHLISQKSDQFSSRLKQASLLYMMEFPEVSLDVLLHLERRLRHQVPICTYSEINRFLHKLWAEEWLCLETYTPEELLDKCFIPCMIYLPAEKDLTPTALCYEMNRSLGFPEDNREEWYDWAIVDGKILLYFLLYLSHRHFGMETNAAADMENVRWLIENDRHLGHRETALNLLGWIYKESGRVDRAVECFTKSLTIQPTHNAAFWHMRDFENV